MVGLREKIWKNNNKETEEYLKSTINTRGGPLGYTALHNAVSCNKAGEVRKLINFGADVNSKSYSGYTPLHIAANNDACSCIEVLLEYNANTRLCDESKKTPLETAISNSFTNSAKLLRSHDVLTSLKQRRNDDFAKYLKNIYSENVIPDFFDKCLKVAIEIDNFPPIGLIMHRKPRFAKKYLVDALKKSGGYKSTLILLLCYAVEKHFNDVIRVICENKELELCKNQLSKYDIQISAETMNHLKSIVNNIKESLAFPVSIGCSDTIKNYKGVEYMLLNIFCDKEKLNANWKGLSLRFLHDDWLKGLTSFKDVILSYNEIKSIPSTNILSYLGAVEKLNLSSNNLHEVPLELFRLPKLCNLNLSSNRLRHLPNVKEWSPFLTTLSLEKNLLESFPSNVEGLLVKHLHLADNRLESVPESICKLKCLETLDISRNEIYSLPVNMGKLSKLNQLILDDLKIRDLPIECKDSRDILNYLIATLRNSKPYYKMKLMIIGSPQQGKTTLLKRLKGEISEGDSNADQSVQGILIEEVKITFQKKEPFIFRVWDFAEQEYFATHQCFLSSSCLYILVWDVTKKSECIQLLKPWFECLIAYVQTFYVIVVGTKLDLLKVDDLDNACNQMKTEIKALIETIPAVRNLKSRDKYFSSRLEICFLSLDSKFHCYSKDLNALQKEIYLLAKTMTSDGKQNSQKIMGKLFPQSYAKLEEEINEIKRQKEKNCDIPIISREEFISVAKSLKCDDDQFQDDDLEPATKFLINTGTILHFDCANEGLRDLFFISPSWVCQFLSKFITLDTAKNGIIEQDKILLVLKDELRNPNLIKECLSLLSWFQVVCKIDDQRCIIPPKLPKYGLKHVLINKNLKKNQSILLTRYYFFSFIPYDFWARFITRFLSMTKEMLSPNIEVKPNVSLLDLPKDELDSIIPDGEDEKPLKINNTNSSNVLYTFTSPKANPTINQIHLSQQLSTNLEQSVNNPTVINKVDNFLYCVPMEYVSNNSDALNGSNSHSHSGSSLRSTVSADFSDAKSIVPYIYVSASYNNENKLSSGINNFDLKYLNNDEKYEVNTKILSNEKQKIFTDYTTDCMIGKFDFELNRSKDVDNDVDNDIHNDVDNDIYNDVDNDIHNDVDNDVNNYSNNDFNNVINNDIKNDTNNGINNDVTKMSDVVLPIVENYFTHVSKNNYFQQHDSNVTKLQNPKDCVHKFVTNASHIVSCYGIASGGIASGGIASGEIASGGIASGGIASGGIASDRIAIDGILKNRIHVSVVKNEIDKTETNFVTSFPSSYDQKRKQPTNYMISPSSANFKSKSTNFNQVCESVNGFSNNGKALDEQNSCYKDSDLKCISDSHILDSDSSAYLDGFFLPKNNITVYNSANTKTDDETDGNLQMVADIGSLSYCDGSMQTISEQYYKNLPCTKEDDDDVEFHLINELSNSDEIYEEHFKDYGELTYLSDKDYLSCWNQGIIFNHPQLSFFIQQLPISIEPDRETIEICVTKTSLGYRVLSYAFDHIRTLLNEWYEGLLISGKEPQVISSLACPVCTTLGIDPPYLFNISTAFQKIYQNSVDNNYYVYCKEKHIPRTVNIAEYCPDLTFQDLPKTMKLNYNDIQCEQNEKFKLGKGGFANVYSGYYKKKIKAAIKFYKFKMSNSDEISSLLDKFYEIRQEIVMLSKLRHHPYIIQFLGFSLKPELCAVMERARHGALSSFIHKRSENVSEFIPRIVKFRICQQIASAVAFMHKKYIIHRDIKSDNILLFSLNHDAKINIKLTDFGTANFMSPSGMKIILGTKCYIAPEMILCKSSINEYNSSVDIYSFAMVLYELIAYRRPFNDVLPFSIDVEVINGFRPKFYDIPEAFYGVVNLTKLMIAMWNQEPFKRPQANDVFNMLTPIFQLVIGFKMLASSYNPKDMCYIASFKELWVICDNKNEQSTIFVINMESFEVVKKILIDAELFGFENFNISSITPVGDMHVCVVLRSLIDVVLVYNVKNYSVSKSYKIEDRYIFSISANKNWVCLGFDDGHCSKVALKHILNGKMLKKLHRFELTGKYPVTTSVLLSEIFIWSAGCSFVYCNFKKNVEEKIDLCHIERKVEEIIFSFDEKLFFISYQCSPEVHMYSTETKETLLIFYCHIDVLKCSPEAFNVDIRVTCMCSVENMLWVGTGSGHILIYEVHEVGGIYKAKLLQTLHPYENEMRKLELVVMTQIRQDGVKYVIVSFGNKLNNGAFGVGSFFDFNCYIPKDQTAIDKNLYKHLDNDCIDGKAIIIWHVLPSHQYKNLVLS